MGEKYEETGALLEGASGGPREAAEAERILNESRSQTPAGQIRMLQEVLERLIRQGEVTMQEGLATRRTSQQDAAKFLKELQEEQAARLKQFDETMNLVFKVAQQTVSFAYENSLRVREQVRELAKPPEPRMTSAEGMVKVGEYVVAAGERIVLKLIESDPAAAEKLRGLATAALDNGTGEPSAAPAPEAPAAPGEAAAAPPPPPQPQPPTTFGELVAVLRTIPQAELQRMAQERGVAPEALSWEDLRAAAVRIRSEAPPAPSPEAGG